MGKSAPSEQKFMAAQSDVTVVTIGFGKATLYDPFDPKETNPTDINATVKNVVTKLIPEITSSMTPKPWQAISHSAGGFNLSQIIMSYPDLFSKALLMHPMMPDCDPYAFVVGLKCDGGLFFIGSEFLESRWIRVTPTTRVKSFSRLPPTMVLVCDQDDFGLVKGPQLFAALGKTGISTYTNCNHYEWRADLAAEFLK